LQPAVFSISKSSRLDENSDKSVLEILDEAVLYLTKGDITKRDLVEWNFTLKEAESYLKFIMREILFRESVIAFLIGETEEEKKERYQKEYERACKIAGRKSGKIEVIDWQTTK
jgi:hypothetical protein